MTAATVEALRSCIAAVLRIPAERVKPDSLLADLVVESFVLVEMAIEVQEDFKIRFSQEELTTVRTVGDLALLIDRKQAGR